MKPLHWDAINPFTGKPFTFDDPNLFWGDPSYYLEPGDPGFVPYGPKPKPTPKPRRVPRLSPTHDPEHPTTTTTMLPYPFITRTGTQNQVTTARVSRGTKTTEQVHAEVTARLGATPPTVANVIQTFLEVVLDWQTEGWTIEPVNDLLGFFLPSGGSFPDTDFQPTFENMGHGPACNFGDAGRSRVATNITYDGQGHQGRIKPEIIRITDNWTGQVDHYTPAKSVCIELGNKKGKREFDRLQGSKVEFRKADGTLVEATDYSVVGTNKINAQVPTGTTGNITETIVTMLINGALRSGSYTTILLP